jgi:hypothetical protein
MVEARNRQQASDSVRRSDRLVTDVILPGSGDMKLSKLLTRHRSDSRVLIVGVLQQM